MAGGKIEYSPGENPGMDPEAVVITITYRDVAQANEHGFVFNVRGKGGFFSWTMRDTQNLAWFIYGMLSWELFEWVIAL